MMSVSGHADKLLRKAIASLLCALLLSGTLFGCTTSSDSAGLAGSGVANAGASALVDSSSSADAASGDALGDDAADSLLSSAGTLAFGDIPQYTGELYAELNDNAPQFSEADFAMPYGYERYSDLDAFGRCGAAFAVVGVETMPAKTEKRGDISWIKPSGWKQNLDVEGADHLYDRSHLLGWQLTCENDNPQNLVTGTMRMNQGAMAPVECDIDDYIEATGNHVLMRVTPHFFGNELVARGIQMEAYSIEDAGAGVCLNYWFFNVQPNVAIDYATGESFSVESGQEMSAAKMPSASGAKLAETDGGGVADTASQTTEGGAPSGSAGVGGFGGSATGDGGVSASGGSEVSVAQLTYVLNTKSHKFHMPDCRHAASMSAKNREEVFDTRGNIIAMGYSPCGTCKP